MNLEFIFRQLHDPLLQSWTPGVHWQVEAYSDEVETGHPVGLCWVSDPSILCPPGWQG
jgi:hypothetical protein